MYKAFKYRLYPTVTQSSKLEWTLRRCAELYNAALQERRDAYKKCGVSVNYHMQAVSLPEVKRARPEYKDIHSQVLQDVLKRLDKAFVAFFRRVKQGQTPGFPRFRPSSRFDSFTYPQYKGSVGGHAYLPKIGNVRLNMHRALEGEVKTLSVKREVDEWYIIVVCKTEPAPLPATGEVVAIDLGLEHFAITSDGEFVDNPRHFRNAQRKLRLAQRSLARKKRGSNRRKKQLQRVAKLHRKVARQRRDFHHKTARKLVDENNVIIVENLNIKGLAGGMLAKSVNDAGWASFLSILSLKAVEAGRRVAAVPAAYSSQDCPQCGRRKKKKLSERWHGCECGCEMHRDVAAASVLKARVLPSVANVVLSTSVHREAPSL